MKGLFLRRHRHAAQNLRDDVVGDDAFDFRLEVQD